MNTFVETSDSAGIRVKHYMPLLSQAQSALPGDRVEDFASVNDF